MKAIPFILWLVSSSSPPSSSDRSQIQNDSSSNGASSTASIVSPSKWSRRTAKKRNQVGELLDRIAPPSSQELLQHGSSKLLSLEVPVLDEAPEIDWLSYPEYDPQGISGGRLKPNSKRSLRKRRQIEAFCHVIEGKAMQGEGSEASQSFTLVDAGCGAGNLAIPLAGLLHSKVNRVVALDVNQMALDRLQKRADDLHLPVETVCTDLAVANDTILKLKKNANVENFGGVIICSLHACGAASDLALRLATHHNLPFVVSPCCTAKAITKRAPTTSIYERRAATYDPSASFQRSGAPDDITYPRSSWLETYLDPSKNEYSILAKVADVGLGPQTPVEQIAHQRRAKCIVELDRLLGIVEQYGSYEVAMHRIKDHDDYGKSEILVGIPTI
jgi:SAM-dependent methyltransferase